jgi:hypothetical protein
MNEKLVDLVEFAYCSTCDWQPTGKRPMHSQAASHAKKTAHSTVSGAVPEGSPIPDASRIRGADTRTSEGPRPPAHAPTRPA